VADNRWNKKLKEEKNRLLNNSKSRLLKSAICGFIAGDGSLQVRKEKTFYHYQLDFFPDDKEMLEKYVEFIEYVYYKKPLVQEKKNFFSVRLTSKTIIVDLLRYAEFGVRKWTIPNKLFKNKKDKKYWLKAFFSAEGTVNSCRIKIQSINKEGLKQVSKLLNDFNIDHREYTYIPHKPSYSQVYVIMIMKRNSRRKFAKEIGFWHTKKEKILAKSLSL
jgi:DNA-binding transcriptional regulator WhiA